jgi:hypothetical protein
MKKYILLVISLFILKNLLIAQSVAELTHQITANKTTDSAKVAAIYDWLTHNVSYDNVRRHQREGDTVLYQEPYNVVAFKKAVCMGYAKTFKEICRLVGIEAVVVEGWVKSPNGKVEREGHAWNAVQFDNNWHLIDATWDAGTADFQKKYFLTTPSVFLDNHLPHDPIWQLSTTPITFNCFANKRDCSDTIPPFSFNFADTIRLWQSLDTTQKLYNQSIRILSFNPNDKLAIRGLADYYGQQATKNFAEYRQIRQAVTDKKRLPNGKDAVLKLLETTTNCLKAAQSQYQKLSTFAKNGDYTDTHLNSEMIEEMLNSLEAERVFVLRYFKN